MDKQGLLLCARYAVAPNFYGYCGPRQNSSLVDHLKGNIADREIEAILSEFETLYLYLLLISKDNKIIDPFDKRVVEAYWLGNPLLSNIKDRSYTSLLQERFFEKKRLDEKNYLQIRSKLQTYNFLPHHSFHVFNIFKRTGNDLSFHTLRTMDECRIAFGKVKCQISNIKTVVVETKPLIIEKKKLKLGSPILKAVKVDYKGTRFIPDLKTGDWVSFHWGFACDILTSMQVSHLEYYTRQSINFFNMI